MAGRVFVTGGSGFVGGAVVDELVRRGHGVSALVNRRPLPQTGDNVRSIPGGLFDRQAIRAGMADCDGVIHLVGIIRQRPAEGITFQRIHVEGTRNIVDAAAEAGIRRYIHMSALGTRAGAASEYHRTKHQAEEYVRASPLQWTIIRPSLIHGPGGEFMAMEAQWARGQATPFIAMPYFGKGVLGLGGSGHLQPVYVGDVARAFVDALEKANTVGHVYPLGGPESLTWPELHRICAETITGKRRITLPIPAWYASAITRVLPDSWLPFNRDQVVMSTEENVGDLETFKKDFGWEPRGFQQTLREYTAQL